MCQQLRAALGGTSLRRLPGLVGPCRHSEAWLLCVEGCFLRKTVLPLVFCGSLGPVPQPPEIGVLRGQNSMLYAPRPTGKPGPGVHHLLAWHNHPALTHTHACAHACLSRQTKVTSQTWGLWLPLLGWFSKDLKQLYCYDN